MKRLLITALLMTLLLALTAPMLAQDDYDESAAISFLVLKDDNGKPVRNAAVVMHPVNKHDKQERGGIELKTDPDGKAYFEGLPYGVLRIQVLAPGFQTFGQDYAIDHPKLTITVRLKRPQSQYSIYTDHQNDKKDQTPPSDNNKSKQ